MTKGVPDTLLTAICMKSSSPGLAGVGQNVARMARPFVSHHGELTILLSGGSGTKTQPVARQSNQKHRLIFVSLMLQTQRPASPFANPPRVSNT
jgi:hypothetical protein